MGEAAVPRDAREIELWLRQYDRMVQTIASGGIYRVPDGSQIRSPRVGRPTETAAINLAVDIGRMRAVEGWLADLEPEQRQAAEYYLLNGQQPIKDLAQALVVPYGTFQKRVKRLPEHIWQRWYAAIYGDLSQGA